jgi:tetratricopeptide (TPR) repeat protein
LADSNEEVVARLLREGLNHYGTGDVRQAVQCWRDVLAIEPDHEEARDYLETAGAFDDLEDGPDDGGVEGEAGAVETEEESAGTVEYGMLGEDEQKEEAHPEDASPIDVLARDAMTLFRGGDLEAALDVFEDVASRDPARIEVQSYIETLRSRLVKKYRDRIGKRDRVPRLRIDVQEVMKFDLPSTAGFLLSQVDGATSVTDLVSLSGLDEFDTLRVLSGLLEAGIVEFGP